MKYVIASSDMANEICHVLHTAIKTIYPKYYPKEVVDFFCRHHSKEHVLKGIASGNMGVLMEGNVIVGTGCLDVYKRQSRTSEAQNRSLLSA